MGLTRQEIFFGYLTLFTIFLFYLPQTPSIDTQIEILIVFACQFLLRFRTVIGFFFVRLDTLLIFEQNAHRQPNYLDSDVSRI